MMGSLWAIGTREMYRRVLLGSAHRCVTWREMLSRRFRYRDVSQPVTEESKLALPGVEPFCEVEREQQRFDDNGVTGFQRSFCYHALL